MLVRNFLPSPLDFNSFDLHLPRRSAIDLAPNLDLTSQLPEIRQILADAKSLDTTSARKSVEFSDKVFADPW